MFTRKRWTPPLVPPGLDADVQKYLRELNRSLDGYLRGLESPDSLTINEATFGASDGSAAAPSYSFASDLDTGWYWVSANTIACSTGGVERVRVDSSGNVGIGVTPFANSLSVGLDLAGGAGIWSWSNNAYLTGNLYYTGGAWKYKASAGGTVLVQNVGDFVFYTAPSGTAGNTATITERLHITEDGRLYGTALHNNSGAVTGTTNQYILSGTFTPTATHVTNVAATTVRLARWIRVGNVVHVAGEIEVDPTATGLVVFDVDIPIASNFGQLYELSGVGGVFGGDVYTIHSPATNKARFTNHVGTLSTNNRVPYTYSYLIL